MDQRAIGVFDSGLGGLTAVREIRRILPDENIVYFGDTARVPYGGRSREMLLKYARQDMNFLRGFDLKAVVIACGTVSTTALDALKQENDIPVIGVVEPACRRAVELTVNRKVGLIATQASIRSGAYERKIAELDPSIKVFGISCPLFVPLVEAGRFSPEDIVVDTIAREYLQPLQQTKVDTLILGCTHYPLLTQAIGTIMGPGVSLVDVGSQAAFALRMLLERENMLAPKRQGKAEYYVSDRPEDFERIGSLFLRETLPAAQKVDIEQY